MNKRKINNEGVNKESELSTKKLKFPDEKIYGSDVVPLGLICYTPIPTLVSIANINLAITLWNEPDIREDVKLSTASSIYDKSFDSIIEKVSQKIRLLCLPNSLKNKVSNIVASIGYEILEWVYTWRKKLRKSQSDILMEYTICCWTNQGTIDTKKTLDLWLKSRDNLEVEYQFHRLLYVAACEHCLEDHILKIWGLLSKKSRNGYLFKEDMYDEYKYQLLAYWRYSIQKKVLSVSQLVDNANIYDRNISIQENMLTLSVFIGNVPATKYFWNKLLQEERDRNIVKWTCLAIGKRSCSSFGRRNRYTDTLVFLLPQMNKEQFKEVFLRYATNVAIIFQSLFYDWPYSVDWSTFLLPTVGLTWNFLQDDAYVFFLSLLASEITRNNKARKVLQAIWYDSPIKFKTCFIRYVENHTEVFWMLCSDVETIKFLLDNANSKEKKKVISFTLHDIEFTKLMEIIPEDKLVHVFHVLITENYLSGSEITSYKESLVRQYAVNLCGLLISNGKWRSVEQFLNWSFTSKDQIDNFKARQLNKTKVLRSLVNPPQFQLATQFLEWCIGSDEEIRLFKKEFAHQNTDLIIEFSKAYDDDWGNFEKLMNFCFNSDEEINHFKKIFTYDKLEYLLQGIMGAGDDGYNLGFGQNLLQFCYSTQQEIHQFKGKLRCSDIGKRIIENYESDYGEGFINYNLVRFLYRWFCPVHEKIIIMNLDSGHLDLEKDCDNLCNCPSEPSDDDDSSS